MKCAMANVMSKEEMNDNSGYHHPAYCGVLYIEKDGVKMKFNEEEIKEIVKVCGGNFKI